MISEGIEITGWGSSGADGGYLDFAVNDNDGGSCGGCGTLIIWTP